MIGKSALVVGSSIYDDVSLPPLPLAAQDILSLAELLRDPQVGAFNKVEVVENPTVSALREKISTFFLESSREDLLLLYFSGHGILDDRDEPYLAVKDTVKKRAFGTAIDRGFLVGAMDRSASRRQVLILDCCYAGDFKRKAKGPGQAAAAFRGNGYGRFILAATEENALAFESDSALEPARNSVFTRFLVEGLRTGEADSDTDGLVTVDDIYVYIDERARRERVRQIPSRWADIQQGSIILALNPNASAILPDEIRVALENREPASLLSAMGALDRLWRSGDKRYERAVIAALRNLQQHDSRLVADAAANYLRSHGGEEIEQNGGRGDPRRRFRAIERIPKWLLKWIAAGACLALLATALVWYVASSKPGVYLHKRVEAHQRIAEDVVFTVGEETPDRSGRPGAAVQVVGFCAKSTLEPGTLLTWSNLCLCSKCAGH